MRRHSAMKENKRRRYRYCHRGRHTPLAGYISISIIMISLVLQHILVPVQAEDNMDYNDEDDYFDHKYYFYYTSAPTPKPTLQPTYYPTISPTKLPTPYPTGEPTRSGDDFYEIEADDGYTAEAQSARIYFSSISDVILCLMCTFFWVLWLVGTIFPTKIQHLYKTEGVVVKGYVVESYASSSTNAEDMQMMEMDLDADNINFSPTKKGAIQNKEISNLTGGPDPRLGRSSDTPNDFELGTTMADDLDIPTFHAIVSYVVPGRIASGARKRLHKAQPLVPLSPVAEDYVLHNEDGVGSKPMKPIETDFTRNDSRGKPPPGLKSTGEPPSPMSCAAVDGAEIGKNTNAKAGIPPRPYDRRASSRSLLDITSFDSSASWKDNEKGYYKYNQSDDSDYESPIGEDEYEDDPEHIGNLFYQFGIFKKQKRKIEPAEPVRVKKRFETNLLLDPGRDDVEIIVLPGNPASGILKSDFEQEEDLKFSNSGSREDDPLASSSQMSELSTGMIGVVLAAVSVIGAVHGALTLPYQERMYGWILVMFSLSIMWPLAMYTYKTVNKLRLYMMNKIINLEPCGDTTGLYGLSRLPKSRMASCSEKVGDAENEYIIMLAGGKKNAKGQGVWNYDEASAISSLSGHHAGWR